MWVNFMSTMKHVQSMSISQSHFTIPFKDGGPVAEMNTYCSYKNGK